VKKIKIGFSNTKELEVTYNKVIREVKSLAALDHPNIVRYHQAWFEPWREEEKSAAEQHYSLEEPSEEFDDEESHSTEGSAPQQGAVKRSLLSEQLNKLNVDDAQDDILFEMDQSLPGRNPSVEFSFDQSPGIGGVQIYENAESEEDDDEPIRNQRVIPESPMASPNMSYLEMAYKQKFKKPSAVLSPTREEPPAPPSIIVNEEDQELQDVRGFLTEIFNEKNLRFEMVLYIQMQLCAPATLETWLWSETRTQERKVDLHAVFHYFRQVVNAIAYVHKNGLIHRDIKPSNIFITHDDRIRIGDFGLAKYIRENLEESPVPPTPTEPTFGEQPPAANRNQNLNANHTTTLSKRKGSPVASAGEHTSGVGTYIYASPEQLAGSQYDETVDVFSLGMILFEMLHPFATKAERAVVLSKVHDFAQIPEYMQQQYPQEMNLVKRCVSKHPKDRPRASEVLINIEKIAAARGLLKPEQNSSLNESMKDLLEEKERMIREQQEMIQKLKAELSKVQKTHTLVQ
jgi:serine/threonine protein kinase